MYQPPEILASVSVGKEETLSFVYRENKHIFQTVLIDSEEPEKPQVVVESADKYTAFSAYIKECLNILSQMS